MGFGSLTANGKTLLREQKNIRTKFREESGFFPAPFLGNFFMKIPQGEAVKIRNSMKRLARALFHLGSTMKENYSAKALKKALVAVDTTSEKLEEINRELKGAHNELHCN